VIAAVAERLIPGARDAGVDRYMEAHRAAFAGALEALAARGFEEAADQDALLAELERERPDLFEPLLAHARQGMFGDPSYGGNVDRAGWKLLGYPGPRPAWTAADQAIGDDSPKGLASLGAIAQGAILPREETT
jgi:Gluconate 2-dehydrogenase subunit 3